MLPALQPSRPKVQQQPARSSYAHQQQRAVHEHPQPPIPLSHSNETVKPTSNIYSTKPRTQIEAMPPFGPGQAAFIPPRTMYDSAVRHPVFFTENLRKPPFPIPDMASHGWNPVANGYIFDQRRPDPNGAPRTKL